jgi:hypothetical protein
LERISGLAPFLVEVGVGRGNDQEENQGMTSQELISLAFSNAMAGRYKRSADVETELRDLLRRSPQERVAVAPKLKSETLVYLLRYRHDTSQAVFGHLYDALTTRTLKVIARFTKGFDKGDSTPDMIAEDVLDQLRNDLFLRDTKRQLFLECNFFTAIKHRTLTALERYKEKAFVQLSATDGTVKVPTGEVENDDALSKLTQQMTRSALLSALRTIKNPLHREAMILRYVDRWPIFDADPTVATLCTRYKKTARQIQNWLNAAKNQTLAVLGDIR